MIDSYFGMFATAQRPLEEATVVGGAIFKGHNPKTALTWPLGLFQEYGSIRTPIKAMRPRTPFTSGQILDRR